MNHLYLPQSNLLPLISDTNIDTKINNKRTYGDTFKNSDQLGEYPKESKVGHYQYHNGLGTHQNIIKIATQTPYINKYQLNEDELTQIQLPLQPSQMFCSHNIKFENPEDIKHFPEQTYPLQHNICSCIDTHKKLNQAPQLYTLTQQQANASLTQHQPQTHSLLIKQPQINPLQQQLRQPQINCQPMQQKIHTIRTQQQPQIHCPPTQQTLIQQQQKQPPQANILLVNQQPQIHCPPTQQTLIQQQQKQPPQANVLLVNQQPQIHCPPTQQTLIQQQQKQPPQANVLLVNQQPQIHCPPTQQPQANVLLVDQQPQIHCPPTQQPQANVLLVDQQPQINCHITSTHQHPQINTIPTQQQLQTHSNPLQVQQNVHNPLIQQQAHTLQQPHSNPLQVYTLQKVHNPLRQQPQTHTLPTQYQSQTQDEPQQVYTLQKAQSLVSQQPQTHTLPTQYQSQTQDEPQQVYTLQKVHNPLRQQPQTHTLPTQYQSQTQDEPQQVYTLQKAQSLVSQQPQTHTLPTQYQSQTQDEPQQVYTLQKAQSLVSQQPQTHTLPTQYQSQTQDEPQQVYTLQKAQSLVSQQPQTHTLPTQYQSQTQDEPQQVYTLQKAQSLVSQQPQTHTLPTQYQSQTQDEPQQVYTLQKAQSLVSQQPQTHTLPTQYQSQTQDEPQQVYTLQKAQSLVSQQPQTHTLPTQYQSQTQDEPQQVYTLQKAQSLVSQQPQTHTLPTQYQSQTQDEPQQVYTLQKAQSLVSQQPQTHTLPTQYQSQTQDEPQQVYTLQKAQSLVSQQPQTHTLPTQYQSQTQDEPQQVYTLQKAQSLVSQQPQTHTLPTQYQSQTQDEPQQVYTLQKAQSLVSQQPQTHTLPTQYQSQTQDEPQQVYTLQKAQSLVSQQPQTHTLPTQYQSQTQDEPQQVYTLQKAQSLVSQQPQTHTLPTQYQSQTQDEPQQVYTLQKAQSLVSQQPQTQQPQTQEEPQTHILTQEGQHIMRLVLKEIESKILESKNVDINKKILTAQPPHQDENNNKMNEKSPENPQIKKNTQKTPKNDQQHKVIQPLDQNKQLQLLEQGIQNVHQMDNQSQEQGITIHLQDNQPQEQQHMIIQPLQQNKQPQEQLKTEHKEANEQPHTLNIGPLQAGLDNILGVGLPDDNMFNYGQGNNMSQYISAFDINFLSDDNDDIEMQHNYDAEMNEDNDSVKSHAKSINNNDIEEKLMQHNYDAEMNEDNGNANNNNESREINKVKSNDKSINNNDIGDNGNENDKITISYIDSDFSCNLNLLTTPITIGWINEGQVEEAFNLHKKRIDKCDIDIFSFCPIHIDRHLSEGCCCHTKKNNLVTDYDEEYWKDATKRYNIFRYFSDNISIKKFINLKINVSETVNRIGSMIRELLSPFFYRYIMEDRVNKKEIDIEKIIKKCHNYDKRNQWDTAYPSLKEVHNTSSKIYLIKNINSLIPVNIVEHICLLKALISLLIAPTNNNEIYEPSSRELNSVGITLNDNIDNKIKNNIDRTVYCILYAIFRTMSHGSKREPENSRKKTFMVACPIFNKMLKVSVTDFEHSNDFKKYFKKQKHIILGRLDGSNLNVFHMKSILTLSGIYGNKGQFMIIPGNCSRLENFFLLSNKSIQLQLSLDNYNNRHISNSEADSIHDNAFFKTGFTSRHYIDNAREDIIGIVPMLKFASLFNDTLKYFNTYNKVTFKKDEYDRFRRVRCSEFFRLILKNSARVFVSNSYSWSFSPNLVRYNHRFEGSEEFEGGRRFDNIRYELILSIYGEHIYKAILNINKTNIHKYIHKRTRKRGKRKDK
uniref:Uncharacterized protein n=1 Tax=Trachysalambria curvirostris majanivirus TaxID=2984281 RepID=A0A9C7BWI9_9VIRU|nr:MAG: hypothetical protein [Trachysalambria curvirostris majanivirus]